MNNGVNRVCRAEMCPDCRVQMAPAYVMRQLGEYHQGVCQRCGKKYIVAPQIYTMKGKEIKDRGLV